jgi:hypothetical protein
VPELEFSKSTDSEHKIKLEPVLVSAAWGAGMAIAGQPARVEVYTAFVGNGAPVKIKVKNSRGKGIAKTKGTIKRNKFMGEVTLPEDMAFGEEAYFEVTLSKNGLDGESNRIPIFPPIEVSSIKWSAAEARRGDVLTLSADISGLPNGSEVLLVIYEFDQDKVHDKITELPATVNEGKVEVKWEYEYHEDTDEIPSQEEMEEYGRSYNPPEYFFTVKCGNNEYATEQESGLLKFKDHVEIELVNQDGAPVPNEDYVLHLPDGTTRDGKLDEQGKAVVNDVPPGRYRVEFPNL